MSERRCQKMFVFFFDRLPGMSKWYILCRKSKERASHPKEEPPPLAQCTVTVGQFTKGTFQATINIKTMRNCLHAKQAQRSLSCVET